MTDVTNYLQQLSMVNRHGFAFLAAYGATWLCAALVWRRFGERAGAYATLFQGMVTLPVAFALTAITARGPRPDGQVMNRLSTYLACGQLMILPLVIVTVMGRRYSTAVAMLAAVTAVHFLPYSWLYQTPLYLVMAVVISIGVATLVRLEARRDRSTGSLVCLLTGMVLSLGAVMAWSL